VISRVLHISNSPYASLRDAGPSYRIFTELAAGGEEYHVLARHESNRFGADREGNLYLHLVPSLNSKVFPLLAYYSFPLIRRYRLEGIVCQDPLLGGVAGVHAGRLFGIPTLLEVHSDLYFHLAASANPYRSALGRLAFGALRRATSVRVGSRNLKPLLERAGVDPSRVAYVPYRVDLELFDPEAQAGGNTRERLELGNGPLVVTVGRFVPQKGYLELIDAFAEVHRRLPQARLVIAGGGPLEASYRERIGRRSLEDAVRLLPWVSRTEQVELLAAADVYTQPSVPGKGEWMPRTILEAMAMRLPVVASDTAGIPDVVHDGENGLLVRPGDGTRLADALVELGSSAELRERLGARARRDAETSYGWDDCFRRYRALVYSMAP
jgi:glycosyltransferase involved in cell wall biosynthesis